MTNDQFDRFIAKVDYTSGACWVWTAAQCPNGYGRFGASGGTHLPHRLSYEHFVGQIPDGLQIDHLCRNRACVNPTHMEPVTAKENTRRGTAGAVTTERNIASKGQPKPPRTPLHRQRALAALRRVHESNIGRTHSAETKQRMAEARRAYWQRKREAA